MDIFTLIAENKIKEALNRGDFNDLPGSGKPLPLEDLSHIPEDLRAGYRILKNAGIVPEEIEIKKEIISLEKLINYCYDKNERNRLTKKLNEKILRFNILMEKRSAASPALSMYKDKILAKFQGS
ncbi:DnaJ family domain-containing protein [Desulfotomaculum sp. 1211_IL3151]|uniref:DnaJ family domain-containing protein n=1 Tax=Desulfotomaculum sp. 1211_IL3151 TaxID=3084055 RepID=UPI002FDB58D6